jgi:bifunctional UDP-N-acetylglucosamine pyrophosphorylase/glucosamine-1-phosphate N-acetyltransferase
MAAGEGTRMRSETPKVLHHVCGRAMIDWPIIAAREAGASRVVVIVGPNRTLESPALGDAEAVVQPDADGTGGAMRAAIEQIREAEEVVVLSGDHPLIDAPMMRTAAAEPRRP